MAKYRVIEETLGNGNKQYHIEQQLPTHICWVRMTKIPYESKEAAETTAKMLYGESVIDYKTIVTYG